MIRVEVLKRAMVPIDVKDYDALIAALLPAVREAGRLEMAHFNNGVSFEQKADRTPVTVADKEAEAIILAALARIAPDVPVVAEEEIAAGKVCHYARRFFLVDALDGTRLFIRRKPEFSINVGYVEDGRTKFGLIYLPPSERLFVTRPDGAYEAHMPIAGDVPFAALRFKRLTTRKPDPNALVAFNSRGAGAASSGLLALLKVHDAKPIGSSMKFCLIAAGEGDLYARFGETCEWDTAAGQAILEAAGGSVTTLDGAPLTYGHYDRAFRNPHFVAWARQPLWRGAVAELPSVGA
ncbi:MULTISPECIES: 3'(2'),5'-bisphosphate nucleotidase CysQ [unclassified Hyphomicrobium]|uniref:3'(2'),5'-bisphosphate nucleotidase CysQ family protein n=1 Tax=unclassified Hyphomicrobium TaxID=2619925 RepID=UPI000213DD6D|nr:MULTISPECIES: 3'(2'),5'-bisphosphate nucleotidase CysQ [unclassified Hyphomicrobium]CCB66385.1 Inositol monophosphatase [Hyphomicrobium sp. MC1]